MRRIKVVAPGELSRSTRGAQVAFLTVRFFRCVSLPVRAVDLFLGIEAGGPTITEVEDPVSKRMLITSKTLSFLDATLHVLESVSKLNRILHVRHQFNWN